jgi:predicted nucleic acid-binding protein
MLVNHTRLEGGNYDSWLKDADDEPILATALVGKAQYIVSWNTRDFPPSRTYAHVRYVTPPEFVDELYAELPQHNIVDET